ncbi:S-adenosylmethionine:tRNA ribosyltransferase-isomerase [Nafulsella turpanensis]|uniref:S-adenosylmethionine:tRNA ribosyltransferase-isomerase n=1 Tax=Nafulsella turpanensis TaxID=1265690 RepID=UPI0003473954|nr:S-adenosylmethionine:tRNA ribosyltransferase-isomerase [Nafulsella turpanensis]
MNPSSPSLFADILLADYRYHLPEEAIAKYPLGERDQSKLLLYRKGSIHHQQFSEIPDLLPENSLLFFNNTRVIPARMFFRKESGAQIEIFLLQPAAPDVLISELLAEEKQCRWKCMIGNLKRWKENTELEKTLTVEGQAVKVRARLENRSEGIVHFQWDQTLPFAALVETGGEIPLPPYLNRKPEESDKPRYQTVYSKEAGAVAAPTAGLHFTQAILNRLAQKDIQAHYLTLHVSAGTFRPIKDSVAEHPMHREQIIIRRQNIEALLSAKGPLIAVGTTSMRTLESLYWYGVKLLSKPDAPFFISKEEAYTYPEDKLPLPKQALEAVLSKMEAEGKEEIWGETEIFIVPGYQFRLVKGLVTNFHQPESTLVLLIAAFIGPDWKKVYQEALSGGYRFLSYGDSSLLLP